MSAQIVAVYDSPSPTRGEVSVNLTTPVLAGDVLVAVVASNQGLAVEDHPTTMAGLGGTFVRHAPSLIRFWSFWVGTGAAGTGPIGTVGSRTLGSSEGRRMRLWHLRGVDPTTIASAVTGVVAAPANVSLAVPADSVVLAVAYMHASSGLIPALSPADSWGGATLMVRSTSPDRYAATAHRVAPVAALHTAGSSAGTTSATGLVSLSAPPPPPPPPAHDRTWWTHRLAASLDLDPVAVQPVVEVRRHQDGAWVLDEELSSALAGYQITYGRKDAHGDVDPVTITMDLATARVPATPAIATRLQVALCEPVATALGLTPDEAIRWTGEVTDPSVDHDARLTRLVGVGQLGRAYRLTVDATTWPAELDGPRVARILHGVPTPLDVGTVDPGTHALASPAGPVIAGRAVETVARSTLGQVVEQPSGVIDYHDADHRRGVVAHVTLSAAAVFSRLSWAQRISDLVNQVDVTTTAGAVTVKDPASADPATGYGPYPASVETALTTTLDGRALGTTLVGRRGAPAWRLPDLTVDLLRTVPLEQLAEVLTLRHGDKLALSGVPDAFPLPGVLFVEGWTETATPRTWRLSVPVTDPMHSGVSLRWVDVPATAAYQWSDLDPDLTWLDVARLEDPSALI